MPDEFIDIDEYLCFSTKMCNWKNHNKYDQQTHPYHDDVSGDLIDDVVTDLVVDIARWSTEDNMATNVDNWHGKMKNILRHGLEMEW